MMRLGHIQLKLAPGANIRAPAHMDVHEGARRQVGSVDGSGQIDRTILSRTSGIRVQRVFHAARSLNLTGFRDKNYDPLEESLGLPQILSITLAEGASATDVVAALRDAGAVEWARVELLSTVPPLANPLSAVASDHSGAFAAVGADAAREMEPGSSEISIAVIDTGIALDHHEFAGKLGSGYDTVDLGMGLVSDGVSLIGDSLGRDFCARDETGHGSHVAGIVGAHGLSMAPGIAGDCRIIPIRALAAARMGHGPVFGVGGLSDIDAGIKAAVDLGAKVLNMSFGTARDDLDAHAPPPHAEAVAYALSRNVIPVAAMGNSGLEEEFFPAALPDVISVGSMSASGAVSDFSTRGPHIALCAPGENVHSTKMEGYGLSTGTSHAAPFIAGACGLLAARARAQGHDLSSHEARRALCVSTETFGRSPDEAAGWGLLNIPAALSRLDEILSNPKEYAR